MNCWGITIYFTKSRFSLSGGYIVYMELLSGHEKSSLLLLLLIQRPLLTFLPFGTVLTSKWMRLQVKKNHH
jgi:hypothetical protein